MEKHLMFMDRGLNIVISKQPQTSLGGPGSPSARGLGFDLSGQGTRSYPLQLRAHPPCHTKDSTCHN